MSTPRPAAPAPAAIGHFIDGRRVAAAGARTAAVFDPARGVRTAEVALADGALVERAIAAARGAAAGWAATAPLQRARVLFRFKALLEAHASELAALISSEHGKVLADARGELTRGIEVVEFACGIPHLLKGEFSENVGSGIDSYSMRPSVGVCVGITPFNFPAMVPLWMVPLALACGNAFVLKPSERAPSCPLRLAELLTEAGLPAGVLNVVNGDREAVEALLVHPKVAAVSFVGSTPVAEHVYRSAAAHGKRVQALGGAKNHMVVLPDADIERAADALLGAAYGAAGERCMAIAAAVAVGAAAEPLVAALRARIARLRVGPATDPHAEMGPLISAEHLQRVRGYIDCGVAEGAELVVDGRALAPPPGCERGFFLGASLFDHVSARMRIYREEIFGPVLVVVRVGSLGQALELVNAHELGNGAVIFTRDGAAARAFAHGVEAGMVGVNVPIPVPMAFHSFGGWKRSLFGPLPVHGVDGVRFYTRLKTVTARWPDTAERDAVLAMPTMQ